MYRIGSNPVTGQVAEFSFKCPLHAALIAFQQKLTPDATIADQFEELSEVFEAQAERLKVHSQTFNGHRRALIPLGQSLA